MNKKGILGLTAIISIVIILLSSGIILKNVIDSGNTISTKQEDLACRVLIEAKGTSFGTLFSFFNEISLRCQKDNLKIKEKSLDETYKKLADETNRCWYRYGEGKVDFLEKWQASGKWCFVCGKVIINSDKVDVPYNDFISWMDKNSFIKDNKKVNYASYIKIKRVNVTDQDLTKLATDINDLENEAGDVEAAFVPVYNLMNNHYLNLLSYNNKRLKSGEENEMYIVYNFDRVDQSFEEQLNSASSDATEYAMGSILLSIATEALIFGGSAAGACAIGGPIALVCGVGGAITGAFKSAFGIVKNGAKLIKAQRTIKRISNFYSFIKKEKKIQTTEELINAVKQSKKWYNPNRLKLINMIKNKGYKSLDDVAKTLDNVKDPLKSWSTFYKEAKLEKIFSKDELLQIKQEAKLEAKQIKQLEKLEKLIKNSEKNSKLILIRKHWKLLTTLLLGDVALNLLEEEPNQQYIDIMDKEEYYRTCGTLPEFK